MDVKPLLNLVSDRLRALPLVVLYITDGCNSRCVTCDIWKLPRRNMDMNLVERLAMDFRDLGVRRVVLSGGEAMQHPQWPRIAKIFHDMGAQVWLLTNGLALKKQAQEVIENLDLVTVSLDGATPETYHAIRGVDALPVILEGMKAVAAGGVPVTTRTTIQRGNFREMPQIVDVAKDAGARQVSFLAVDVSSEVAFGPRFGAQTTSAEPIQMATTPALSRDDLLEFAAVLDSLERSHADDFANKRIAESPAKLRRLYRYFTALNGLGDFETPRCNAPHISTVINLDGSIRPCFFLPVVSDIKDKTLSSAINSPEALALRKAYRSGERQECTRCVCPLYRGPRALLRE
ncbi:MAG TPA: radical SAM protein [Aggregatilineales bacterium]|nr:radical SAM protein [Aggregatilineales bacterium]